jgi:hypothetical protein
MGLYFFFTVAGLSMLATLLLGQGVAAATDGRHGGSARAMVHNRSAGCWLNSHM